MKNRILMFDKKKLVSFSLVFFFIELFLREGCMPRVKVVHVMFLGQK